MTGPKPITKQRSPWEERRPPQGAPNMPGGPRWFSRRTGDGLLLAIVAEEPMGWHMSVSFRDNRGNLSRYPTWDEITHARYELLPDDREFVMFLPPPDTYLSVHDTTFHLHEHPARGGAV